MFPGGGLSGGRSRSGGNTSGSFSSQGAVGGRSVRGTCSFALLVCCHLIHNSFHLIPHGEILQGLMLAPLVPYGSLSYIHMSFDLTGDKLLKYLRQLCQVHMYQLSLQVQAEQGKEISLLNDYQFIISL